MYDYYGFCREVCYLIVTNNENVIGGDGKIVQIDKSHIYLLTVVIRRLKLAMNKWQYSVIDIKTVNLCVGNFATIVFLLLEFVCWQFCNYCFSPS